MTTPLRIDGVDISHHQQGTFDYEVAKKAGLKFVYHKATEGATWVDFNYIARRAECAKEGIPFGAYHFARPERGADALVEAKHFLAVAKPVAGDLIPVLDLEVNTESLSQAEIATWVGTFIQHVRKVVGVTPMIYTPYDLPRNFLKKNFGAKLWLARYSNSNEPPRIPTPWTKWDLRQFSNGQYGVPNRLSGIGHVDLNTFEGGDQSVESITIPSAKLGEKFKAATWNVFHETPVSKLSPILAELIADGVSIFLMQEAGGNDITKMLRDANLKQFIAPPQYRVAWNDDIWRLVDARTITGEQVWYDGNNNKQVSSIAAALLVHRGSGRRVMTICYHTPAHVQTKNPPRPRLLALREQVEIWKRLARENHICLFGGDDNVDETGAYKELFGFMSDENTGLEQIQAPEPTHAGGRRIDDFRIKNLTALAGYTRPGGGDHKIHVRTFRLPEVEISNNTARFRVVTQNVMALPRMPQPDVVEDVTLTAKQAGIIGWQEIVPDRYENAIRDLGEKWEHFIPNDPAGNTPISWRKKYWKLLDSGSILMHEAHPLISKARYLNWVLLRHRKTQLPMYVCNAHFVPGAWTSHDRPELRQELWRKDQAVVKAFAKSCIKQNIAVLGLGDYNSSNERELVLGEMIDGKRVTYLVPKRSIDQLWVIDSSNSYFDATDTETLLGRNSDHQGRRATLRLSKSPILK